MNYKMLLPDYRARYLSIFKIIGNKFKRKNEEFLDIGCGEADFHINYVNFFSRGNGVDINKNDIKFARKLNKQLPIQYESSSYEKLCEKKKYGCIICTEVIEHVNNPKKIIKKTSALLKNNGIAIFTFPRYDFPFFYDPINYILNKFNLRLPIGAYSFGHNKLIKDNDFAKWVSAEGLEIIDKENLGGPLISILQIYWVGLIQKLIKANQQNNSKNIKKKFLRPTSEISIFTKFTDFIVQLDKGITTKNSRTIGALYILRKQN